MWKDKFASHILKRGQKYYDNNQVEDVKIEDNIIEGTVSGSDNYQVQIVMVDGDARVLKCTCPHATSGNHCKHMAAVLFYAEDKEGNATEAEAKPKVKGSATTMEDHDVTKMVEEADPSFIKEFLVGALEEDEKLWSRFKSSILGEVSKEDMKMYKSHITDIFNGHRRGSSFVGYTAAWNLASELNDFLNNDVRLLLKNNHLNEAFTLTNNVFLRIGKQVMDDSAGGTTMVATTCVDIWQEIIDKSDDRLKTKMFNWYLKRLDGSVIDYMEEYIEEMLFVNFMEEKFLKKKLAFIDKELDKEEQKGTSWSSDYTLGKLQVRRLVIMEAMGESDDVIIRYIKERLDNHQVRDYYIDLCIRREDYDTAIALLKEGQITEKNYAGIVNQYKILLKEVYKLVGDDEQYLEALWELVLENGSRNFDLYKELESNYTEEEWVEKREIVFSKLESRHGIDSLYKYEGLYDRLLEVVLDSYRLGAVEHYEKLLMETYPEELLGKYVKEIEEMAVEASSRPQYRNLVKVLRRMEKYPKSEEKIKEIIATWEEQYKHRPAMMDELRKY